MARRRTRTWLAAAGLLALAAAMTGIVLVLGLRPPRSPAEPPGSPVENHPAQGVETLRTTRLPVAGSPGFFVLVHPDGRSELETPSGIQPLLDAAPATPTEDDVARRVAAELSRRTHPETKNALTQVVVLDQGIVDVPADAVVTLIAPDRAVAVLKDGSTSVFFADGRVMRRELRQPKPPPLATNPE